MLSLHGKIHGLWTLWACLLDQHPDLVALKNYMDHHFCVWSTNWWVWPMEIYHNQVVATVLDCPCWLGFWNCFGWQLAHQMLLQMLVHLDQLYLLTVTCISYYCDIWKYLILVQNLFAHNHKEFTLVQSTQGVAFWCIQCPAGKTWHLHVCHPLQLVEWCTSLRVYHIGSQIPCLWDPLSSVK